MKLTEKGLWVLRIRRGDETLFLGSITGEPPVADPRDARKFTGPADAVCWAESHPAILVGQEVEAVRLAEVAR